MAAKYPVSITKKIDQALKKTLNHVKDFKHKATEKARKDMSNAKKRKGGVVPNTRKPTVMRRGLRVPWGKFRSLL